MNVDPCMSCVCLRLSLLQDKAALSKPLPQQLIKEFIGILANEGYMEREQVKMNVPGQQYARSWEVYKLTGKGRAVAAGSQAIILPVPDFLRKAEHDAKQAAVDRVNELKGVGVDTSLIPDGELESGHGEVMSTMLEWHRMIKSKRERGQEDSASRMTEMLDAVIAWRDRKAKELVMAPASVLPEHCAMKVVKCKITTVDGLRAAGVRIVGSEELADLLLSFRGQDKDDNSETLADDEPIGLPKGEWTGKGWKHAVYVPGKAGKKKPWEDSYARFKAGEDISSIALNREAGKASIQVNTVVGHILTALSLPGNPVDLGRLVYSSDASSIPTKAEWQVLEDAAAEANINVVEQQTFFQKEILKRIVATAEKEAKSDGERQVETEWYSKIRFWAALKQAGVPVDVQKSGGEREAKKTKL